MKNKVIAFVLAGLMIAGCATQTGQTEQALIITAASTGTAIYLSNNKQDAPYFVATESVLNALSGSTNQINSATIEAALASAGQTNAVATIATINAINLADAFIADSSPTNSQAFQQAAGWVATGIGRGLAMTPAQLKAVVKASGN